MRASRMLAISVCGDAVGGLTQHCGLQDFIIDSYQAGTKGWLLAQVGEVVVIEIARVSCPGWEKKSREEWSGGHND